MKVLWIVAMDAVAEARLLSDAKSAEIDSVCIRTTSNQLPGAIGRFHAQNIKVYAWRWPAVVPNPGSSPHYYASDEASFVVETLLPAGLDGYIVDPESDNSGDVNDWNQDSLATLAQSFCATIKEGAVAAGLADFRFGLTSGCNYPNPGWKPSIPWPEFVSASDTLYPQTYWRTRNRHGDPVDINGGTPDAAINRGRANWRSISEGKPIVYMAGELDLITPIEIAAYGTRAKADGLSELHFYCDNGTVPAQNWQAIRAL